MYVFLLILGGVISATGLALLGSGLSVQERAFDPTNVTAATIAIIGGAILVGLALVVRALLRVEQAFTAARSITPPAPPAEPVADAVVVPTEPAAEKARIPFPPKPKTAAHPPPTSVAEATPPAAEDDAALERLREKFPSLVRLDPAPVVVETDVVSLLPKAPPRPEENVGEVDNAPVAARVNGSAPAKASPPVELNGRPPRRPERAKNSLFDSLWPKAQQAIPQPAQTAPIAQAAPSPLQMAPAAQPAAPLLQVVPTGEPSPTPSAEPVAVQQDTPTPVSILKSGVVEGMAYTLFSDGSIEAQLPQGTMRFGSITELRNHIEQNP
jgi:hypothetical protein